MELFDIDEYDLDGRLSSFLYGDGSESSFEDSDDFDYFDESIEDIDFSQIEGDNFKNSFTTVKNKISKVIVPNDRNLIVEGQSRRFTKPMVAKDKISFVKKPTKFVKPNTLPPTRRKVLNKIPIEQGAIIRGRNQKLISKVIVPRDRNVIVEGISKFILSQDKRDEKIKQIGYYKGKKLKELIIEINNDTLIDFDVNLFDPSMPLDYLYSTSQNLNNRITIAGGNAQYTDILYNILGNPPIIHSAYFTFNGASGQILRQEALALKFINKNIQGYKKIDPLNLSLKIDNMQTTNDVVAFELHESLNRPFIPDGMDTITYTIYAGMRVTMAFFYEQVQIKEVFYKEARESKRLL
jgi:hypothetical protein